MAGPALGTVRANRGRAGRQDRRGEEDRADPAAPPYSPVAGRAQGGRARRRGGGQGPRRGDRPGQRLTGSCDEGPARHYRRAGLMARQGWRTGTGPDARTTTRSGKIENDPGRTVMMRPEPTARLTTEKEAAGTGDTVT